MISKIVAREETHPDIQQYVHARKVDKIVVPLSEALAAARGSVLVLLRNIIGALMAHQARVRLSFPRPPCAVNPCIKQHEPVCFPGMSHHTSRKLEVVKTLRITSGCSEGSCQLGTHVAGVLWQQ